MTSQSASGEVTAASLQRLSDGGRSAEVFEWGEGTVLKLARHVSFRRGFEMEALALQAANAMPGLAPEYRGSVEIDGRPGLLMERLDGIDLLTEAEKKPWRIARIGRELAEQHARLHEVAAPAGLPSVKQRLERRLESDAVPAEVRERARTWLAAAPGGDRLCHGDFHPGNLMRSSAGLRVIDFANAAPGHPDGDHAATLCLLRLGAAPANMALWLRLVLGVARRVVLRNYTRRYRQLRPVDPAAIANWERIFLAQRLDDRIPEERERIMAELRAAMRGTSASVSERAG